MSGSGFRLNDGRPRELSVREKAESHMSVRAARAGPPPPVGLIGATSWDDETFEEWVCAALIASHERRLRKVKKEAPVQIRKPCLAPIRKHGLFIPSGDRLIDSTLDAEGRYSFDVRNDPLPERGVYALSDKGSFGRRGEWVSNPYMVVIVAEQASRMPKGWTREDAGRLYSVKELAFGDEGYAGTEHYVTISRDGAITACRFFRERLAVKANGTDYQILGCGTNEGSKSEMSFFASTTLQFQADRRYTWSIDAYDSGARVNLGCTKEEVKSLLYARTLPLTPSGRRRPIMHLVQAHRRRIASGTDIDVTAFLRGKQEVEIDGTLFRVRAPVVQIPSLSANSVKNYYTPSESGEPR